MFHHHPGILRSSELQRSSDMVTPYTAMQAPIYLFHSPISVRTSKVNILEPTQSNSQTHCPACTNMEKLARTASFRTKDWTSMSLPISTLPWAHPLINTLARKIARRLLYLHTLLSQELIMFCLSSDTQLSSWLKRISGRCIGETRFCIGSLGYGVGT